MKFLIGLAVFFAVIAIGFLCASLFVEGGALVYTSIGAGLSLVAFILVLVGYASKAAN